MVFIRAICFLWLIASVITDSSFESKSRFENRYETLSPKEDCDVSIDPDKDVLFMLYTRDNPTDEQILKTGDVSGLINSNYNHDKDTRIYIHGWNTNYQDEGAILMRDATVALDGNAIIVQWYEKANPANPCGDLNVEPVGTFIGNFITWLVSQGSNLDNFHVSSHSLGSHVMGFAGRTMTIGKIPYLTALDPPLFANWGPDSPRVRVGDGKYLEVIHTNINIIGIREAIGDNDFYPNGGKNMPGCTITNLVCSHLMAFRYFGYSLNNTNFVAGQCRDYDEMAAGLCSNITELHMGGPYPKPARGVFYLKTGPDPPYYL